MDDGEVRGVLRDAGECVSATELGDAGAKQVARLLLAGVRLQQSSVGWVGRWGRGRVGAHEGIGGGGG